MADQIYAPGPLATPAKYVVPGSSEIVPLAVQAVLDGTNASGDFVPTLIFRSQAGHVIARVPTSTTVVAGGSAEVSWFPHGVTAAPAAPSSAISYAWGWRDSNSGDATFDFNIGQQRFVPFLHTSTSNAAVMKWRTISSAFDVLDLLVPGLYDLKLFANLTALEDWAMFLRGDSQDQAAHTAIATTAQSGALSPPRGIDTHQDYTIYNVTGSASVRAYVQNNTGFFRQTFGYWYVATYLGVPA